MNSKLHFPMLLATFVSLQALLIAQTDTPDAGGDNPVNLVINGGFEDPSIGMVGWVNFETGTVLPGWLVGLGGVDIVWTEYFEPNSGVQSLDLNGWRQGSITQTFETMPGATYSLECMMAANPYCNVGGCRYLTVVWDSVIVGTVGFNTATVTRYEMGWTLVEIPELVATSPTTDLTFYGTGGGPCDGVAIDDVVLYQVSGPWLVDIDIKPGGIPNPISASRDTVVPVAVLGSEFLDVSAIDPATCRLEELGVKCVGKDERMLAEFEDVNADGYTDLVLHFQSRSGVFSQQHTSATLTGNLNDGSIIIGTDTIVVMP